MRPLFDIVSRRAAQQHGRITWDQLLADVARRRRSHHTAYTYGDIHEHAARTAAEVKHLLG